MKIFYVFVVLAIAMSSAYGQTTLTRSQCVSDDAQAKTLQRLEKTLLAKNVGDYRRACELSQENILQLEACRTYYSKDFYDQAISQAYQGAKQLCTCARTNAC
jgi:hypothetical protein